MCRKFFCCIISLIMIFFMIPEYSAYAEYYPIESENLYMNFSEYYDLYCNEKYADNEITVIGSDYSRIDGSCSTDGDTLVIESGAAEISYTIEVPESGIYCLKVNYSPLVSYSSDIEFSLKIDDIVPYDTASRLILKRVWADECKIYADSRGNQIRPAQVQKCIRQESFIKDPDGLYNEPLFFYFEKGSHEITFDFERAELILECLCFCKPPKTEDYFKSDIYNTSSVIFRVEGEDALYKSDSVLSPTYDNSSYMASPADPVKVMYNTIGADGSWKEPLQSITWEIPADKIGEGGYFKLGIKARQNQMRGFYSNRRIYIDGETPCSELECVEFAYDNDWSIVTPTAKNGDYIYVYLEGGSSHTITMECVTGDISEPIRRLNSAVDRLNDYYRQILMITSPYPDKYTDYYVHEKIPELLDVFADISQEFKDIQNDIEKISHGSEAAFIGNTAVILDKCVEKPLKIPDYLSQINESIISLSALMNDYCDQPLEIDYIEFASYDVDFPDCTESISDSIIFGFKSFIGSFFEDYTTLSDVNGEEAVEVWVAASRDNALIVRELTESYFRDYPIAVSLVSGGIVEASLAGKEPDCALFLGGEFPFNLASRGLLADISQYNGFSEVTSRFQENALTHYQYNGGTYGLPLTQSFPMMFYRTDILSELNIHSPPETWDDLINMLPAIQRNYMSVGLVLPSSDISPATESGHTFALLMLQNGLSYYNDDFTMSFPDMNESVQAFEMWTNFYTDYSFSQAYDAFTRFRVGEYPIVIANYSFAGQLESAAPEIKGLWDFCPVPGTLQADGNVSHSANSNTSGAVIFSSSDKKSQAWEFIKWFTGNDIQAQYGIRTENLLGAVGRYETANISAMKQLPWSDSQFKRLKAQWSELKEIPIIPASYAFTRNVMNAFRDTVNEGENPRDMLIWYSNDINDEIKRKSER